MRGKNGQHRRGTLMVTDATDRIWGTISIRESKLRGSGVTEY